MGSLVLSHVAGTRRPLSRGRGVDRWEVVPNCPERRALDSPLQLKEEGQGGAPSSVTELLGSRGRGNIGLHVCFIAAPWWGVKHGAWTLWV